MSGADDQTLRIWDYQTRSCVSTLEGHTNNVCAVVFHPRLPLILSGSEDGTVRVWHNTTYRLETTLNYGMERVWSLGVTTGNQKVAMGCDEGTVVVKLGREVPIVSLDRNGKLVVCVGGERRFCFLSCCWFPFFRLCFCLLYLPRKPFPFSPFYLQCPQQCHLLCLSARFLCA